MAKGTVLSFSPEMINSGPRSGFLVSTFASVHELRLVVAPETAAPRRPALRRSHRDLSPLLTHGVGEAKLFVGEWKGTVGLAVTMPLGARAVRDLGAGRAPNSG